MSVMAKQSNLGKCQGKVETFLGFCERKSSVVRDGVPYCWQHDPERHRAKARERREQLKKEDAAREARFCRQELERAAGLRPDQISELTDDQLRSIAEAGGVTAFIF